MEHCNVYKGHLEMTRGMLAETHFFRYHSIQVVPKHMGSAENDEYPKTVLQTAICQYYLSKGYEDLRLRSSGTPTILTVFSESSRNLQVHHVIPLGAGTSVSESTKEIRKNKTHVLNSPLNMVYITEEANRAISNMSLGEYSSLLPSSAGLINLGFSDTDLLADATDESSICGDAIIKVDTGR